MSCREKNIKSAKYSGDNLTLNYHSSYKEKRFEEANFLVDHSNY